MAVHPELVYVGEVIRELQKTSSAMKRLSKDPIPIEFGTKITDIVVNDHLVGKDYNSRQRNAGYLYFTGPTSVHMVYMYLRLASETPSK